MKKSGSLFLKGKIAGIVLSAAMILGSFGQPQNVYATQSRSYNFSTNYTLSDSQADNLVEIAKAQLGKNKGNLGYTESWCADFVSDCARLAGLSDIIPANGLAAGLYRDVINAGGKVVKNPRKGDLIFYYCKRCGRICHTGIMISNYESVEGNYSRKVSYVTKYYNDSYGHSVSNGTIVRKYVRPDYKKATNWNVSCAVLKEGTATKVLNPVTVRKTRVKNYISSNKKVASVSSSGKIIAKKKGVSYITAVFKNGNTASMKLKVQKQTVKTKKIKVSKIERKLNVGDKLKIKTAITPITSAEKITFKSSNPVVMTVSSKGVIKAKSKGVAVITIRSGKATKKLKFIINEVEKADESNEQPVIDEKPDDIIDENDSEQEAETEESSEETEALEDKEPEINEEIAG